MGASISYREEKKHKNGKAKYAIERKVAICTYRGADGKTYRKIANSRRIVRK